MFVALLLHNEHQPEIMYFNPLLFLPIDHWTQTSSYVAEDKQCSPCGLWMLGLFCLFPHCGFIKSSREDIKKPQT